MVSRISRRELLKRTGQLAASLGIFQILPKALAQPKGVVTLVTSPDDTTGVIWKYAQDSGLIGRLADEYGYVVNVIRTWDDFPIFAGGHADIASFSAMEIPLLEEEMQERLTVYGKLQSAYTGLTVRPDSPYKTPPELVGKRFGISGWPGFDWKIYSVLAKKVWDIDFRRDYNIVINDYFVLNESVARGRLDACISSPSHGATPYLMRGELEITLEFDVFCQKNFGFTPSLNAMTARQKWYNENEEAAEMMLRIWQLAVDEFYKDPEGMLLPYPELLGVTNEEECRFVIEWAFSRGIPPVEQDVTITEEWVKGQLELIALGKEVGFIPKDAPDPDFRVVKL